MSNGRTKFGRSSSVMCKVRFIYLLYFLLSLHDSATHYSELFFFPNLILAAAAHYLPSVVHCLVDLLIIDRCSIQRTKFHQIFYFYYTHMPHITRQLSRRCYFVPRGMCYFKCREIKKINDLMFQSLY